MSKKIWLHTTARLFDGFNNQNKNIVNGEYYNPIWLTQDKGYIYSNDYLYCTTLVDDLQIFDGNGLLKHDSGYIEDSNFTNLGKELEEMLFTTFPDDHSAFSEVMSLYHATMGRVEVMKFIKDKGFDGYYERGESSIPNLAIFDPSNIRIIKVYALRPALVDHDKGIELVDLKKIPLEI